MYQVLLHVHRVYIYTYTLVRIWNYTKYIQIHVSEATKCRNTKNKWTNTICIWLYRCMFHITRCVNFTEFGALDSALLESFLL